MRGKLFGWRVFVVLAVLCLPLAPRAPTNTGWGAAPEAGGAVPPPPPGSRAAPTAADDSAAAVASDAVGGPSPPSGIAPPARDSTARPAPSEAAPSSGGGSDLAGSRRSSGGAPTPSAAAGSAPGSAGSAPASTAGAAPPPDGPIPNLLVFTYRTNLMETKEPKMFYDNVRNTIGRYRAMWDDPDATVWFLDDDSCRVEIASAHPPLLPHFEGEKQGKFRADVCRIAALYNRGGHYFDVDLKTLVPVDLGNSTRFATVASPLGTAFFQAWMASVPRHPVLKRTLEIMTAYYEGTHKLNPRKMGCSALKDAYDDVDPPHRGEVRLLSELNLAKNPTEYPDIPRQDGVGCCCNYVVHDGRERRVYFFSRFVGASVFCEPPKKKGLRRR